MENLGLIVGVVLFVAAVTVLLSWYQARKRADVWQGTVTKIKRKTVDRASSDETPDYRDYVYVHFQKDNGKKGKLSLEAAAFNKLFPDLQVNDRLNKQAGQDYPQMV